MCVHEEKRKMKTKFKQKWNGKNREWKEKMKHKKNWANERTNERNHVQLLWNINQISHKHDWAKLKQELQSTNWMEQHKMKQNVFDMRTHRYNRYANVIHAYYK